MHSSGCLLDLQHAEHVGSTRDTLLDTADDNAHVTRLAKPVDLGSGEATCNERGGAHHRAHHHGIAPAQHQALSGHLLIAGGAQNRHVRLVLGDKACRAASLSEAQDEGGAEVKGRLDRRRGDGLVNVLGAEGLGMRTHCGKCLRVIQHLFGLTADGHHSLDGLDRILPLGGLTGKHHAISAYSVCVF